MIYSQERYEDRSFFYKNKCLYKCLYKENGKQRKNRKNIEYMYKKYIEKLDIIHNYQNVK